MPISKLHIYSGNMSASDSIIKDFCATFKFFPKLRVTEWKAEYYIDLKCIENLHP